MAKVFFSYSHVDEALRDQLEVHLAMLKRQGLIESWHDRRIMAGSNLTEAIDKKLEESDVILLLVSPDFLASDYCYTLEMTRALERHHQQTARVIPIILRPCDWASSPLKDLLAVPKDGKAVTTWPNVDEAFADVTRQVRRVVEDSHANSRKPEASSTINPVSVVQSKLESHAKTQDERPRSSNLRLKKEFTDLDRDQFLHDSFEYMARFFESSLEELSTRNPGIKGRYQRVDARRFTAVIYRDGKSVAECTIRIDGFGDRSNNIAFAYSASAPAGSSNEMLHVENDSQALYFKPLGMQSFSGRQEQKLSQEGASEYLWELLIERVQ